MADDQRFAPTDPLADLVAAARAGHQAAWRALVERLQRVVWKSVNMMTFDREIRDDAFAATWLRLAERLDTIREPEKLPGWLTTTATNEVRQILRQRGREPVAVADLDDPGAAPADLVVDGDHSGPLVAAERDEVVRAAFARLDENCRQVITVLVLADPPMPYDEASAVLGRPIGSLGPTRGRCLDKMKKLLASQPDHGGAP